MNLEKAKIMLTERYNVMATDLEYIGCTEEELPSGRVRIFHFNVENPKHSRHGSTVCQVFRLEISAEEQRINEEAKRLGLDARRILIEHGTFMAKTELIKRLRNSWRNGITHSRSWSFSAGFINYEFDKVLAGEGIQIRFHRGATYFFV